MYRVGDFFESFFEDAHLLASTCDIALTTKDAGKALGTRVPMAGVPHYAIDDKIKLLLGSNVTVVVVDQLQSAADVPAGKLVKRAVTRLITPGTAGDDALLNAGRSCYLAAVVLQRDRGSASSALGFGFAYTDVSTGEFRVTDGKGIDALRRLLVNTAPAEVLVVGVGEEVLMRMLRELGVGVISKRKSVGLGASEAVLEKLHAIDSVESLGCRGRPLSVEAAASLVLFTRDTLAVESQDELPLPLDHLQTFSMGDQMWLDDSCLRNLEVVETVRDGNKEGSLLRAVDRTITSMGARCLRAWLLAPSLCLRTIEFRHTVVEALINASMGRRMEIQTGLKNIADLERIGGRVGAHRATPRELRWLCESILRLPVVLASLRQCFNEYEKEHVVCDDMRVFATGIDEELMQLANEVHRGLVDPAPSSLVSEMILRAGALSKENLDVSSTRIFREGFCEKLDRLRKAANAPEQWISPLEEQERVRSGVEALRIKHIKNTGYVLRIPRSAGEKKLVEDPMFFVKLGYERAQSTKAELRFRFDQLRMHEREHNSTFSEILLHELQLYSDLQRQLAQHIPHVRSIAKRIASIDVLAGFAQVAEEQLYTRPVMHPLGKRTLHLQDARHPVVEQTLPVGRTFVPNSFQLGSADNSAYPDLMILCGPNAAGKSCALRSVGAITILAQAGSFVPADHAELSLCDRIFTRVGAVDDVSRGQSTFQVEMAETACILSHATSSSLVLLDEVGRGTSTVDGIAIAWSVSEYLARQVAEDGSVRQPSRAIFATHYHELNQLASMMSNVKPFRVHVEKRSEPNGSVDWVTTHKILPGESFDSLGLAVARRAGLPPHVVERAETIATLLRAPAKALGRELGAAISNSGGKLEEGTIERTEVDSRTVRLPSIHERIDTEGSFEAGYAKGYATARAEILKEVKDLVARMTSST